MVSLSKITVSTTSLGEIKPSPRGEDARKGVEGIWKILISGLLPPNLVRDRNAHPIQ